LIDCLIYVEQFYLLLCC